MYYLIFWDGPKHEQMEVWITRIHENRMIIIEIVLVIKLINKSSTIKEKP